MGIKNQKAGLPVYFGNPAILLSLKWLVSFYSTNQLKVNKTRGFPLPDFSGFGFINKKIKKPLQDIGISCPGLHLNFIRTAFSMAKSDDGPV